MKAYRDGTHRVLAPAETLRTVASRKGLFGVTRLSVVTGLDHIGIPVAVAVRPNSRNLSAHQGKGASTDAAKVSALMEAYECACVDARRGPTAWLDPASPELRWVRDHFGSGPATTGRDRPIPCMAARDVLGGGNVLIPEEVVFLDYSRQDGIGQGHFVSGSFGVAAGNNRAEAVLHALCELIERDATILWGISPAPWRETRRRDPRRCPDPAVQHMLDRYAAAGMRVETWEITTELGVPAFTCLIDDAAARPPFLGRFGGSGCHPNAGVALSRALAEAAQSRLTFIVGTRDDISWTAYDGVGWRRSIANIIADPPPPDTDALPPPQALSFDGDSIEEDLHAVLDRLAAAGMQQVLQVDLDLPEVGIPCVRMMVPDLEVMPGIATRRRRPRVLARLAE